MGTSWRRTLRRWLGDRVEIGLGEFAATLRRIAAAEDELRSLHGERLRSRARSLRAELGGGRTDERAFEDVFAVTREIARRTLGLRPTDEQMAAGLALWRGAVVEMPTGEGKTLAAVAPVVAAAATGSGAHVLTFNDYLARRDADWMGPVYDAFGLRVGVVQEGMDPATRRRAYAADITYLTAREAGFDFLRNQLCLDVDELQPRRAEFALVDEADSILVDEARVPLVIAGAVDAEQSESERVAELARRFAFGVDFDTDDHGHNIFLTEEGSRRAEEALGAGSLYDEPNLPLLADLRNALHAHHLIERDRDYIVRRGRVELIDDFTGRVADNRKWPDGLQEAIEAKERLEIRDEGRILGSITMHHFVKSYPRLCGMTATARSSAEELADFYDLDVVVLPPHRPCVRIDHEDRIFTHREAKRAGLVREIAEVHATGRPVLVGTASVAESEELAAELVERGVSCRVLNAKNDELEASIVAQAGAVGAVTISTNMAGRGTDIKLGGSDEADRDRVVKLGGLYVVGTNRHESLRIDRQLRGRSGRQGDPGSSRFFVSLEDPLIVRYGVGRLIGARSLPDRSDDAVDAPVLRVEIARAQRIIEGENFATRKRLWEFSAVIEAQRRVVQRRRREILTSAAKPELLQCRCADRWRSLESVCGTERLEEIERRLTLVVMDRCWSDHLAELARIRDGIHVVGYVGKDPATEFCREAGEAFGGFSQAVDDEIVESFLALEVGPAGVDWRQSGLVAPSATWTYLVSDAPFGGNALRNLANRAGFAAIGAIAAAPVLFLWGLLLHWRRRRLRAEMERRER